MRITAVLLIVCLFLAAACTAKSNERNFERNFEIDRFGTVMVYKGMETSVVIPQKIGNTQITAIGDKAFKDKNLTSVTIPDSVTLIGYDAFSGNNLNSVTIGADVLLGLRAELEFHFVFDEDFDNFYNRNHMRAGTYVLENGRWSMK